MISSNNDDDPLLPLPSSIIIIIVEEVENAPSTPQPWSFPCAPGKASCRLEKLFLLVVGACLSHGCDHQRE